MTEEFQDRRIMRNEISTDLVLSLDQAFDRPGQTVDPKTLAVADRLFRTMLEGMTDKGTTVIHRGSLARDNIEGPSITADGLYSRARKIQNRISPDYLSQNPAWAAAFDRLHAESDIDIRFAGFNSDQVFFELLMESLIHIAEDNELSDGLSIEYDVIPIVYADGVIAKRTAKQIVKLRVASGYETDSLILDLGNLDCRFGNPDSLNDRRLGACSTVYDNAMTGLIEFGSGGTIIRYPKKEQIYRRCPDNGLISYGGIGHNTQALRVLTQRVLRGDAIHILTTMRALMVPEIAYDDYDAEKRQYLLMLAAAGPQFLLELISIAYAARTFKITRHLAEKFILPATFNDLAGLEKPDYQNVLDAISMHDWQAVLPRISTDEMSSIAYRLNKSDPLEECVEMFEKAGVINNRCNKYDQLLDWLTPVVWGNIF